MDKRKKNDIFSSFWKYLPILGYFQFSASSCSMSLSIRLIHLVFVRGCFVTWPLANDWCIYCVYRHPDWRRTAHLNPTYMPWDVDWLFFVSSSLLALLLIIILIPDRSGYLERTFLSQIFQYFFLSGVQVKFDSRMLELYSIHCTAPIWDILYFIYFDKCLKNTNLYYSDFIKNNISGFSAPIHAEKKDNIV